MPNFIRIGNIEDFPEGQGRMISAARKPVAVFKVNGKIYAVNNICPHMGGPIGGGEVEGTTVSCPYHHMCFDLETGRSADSFGHSLQTYPVKVEDGEVWIDAWWAKNGKR
jgi:NAD(P)H-dependent nitrite reductase small subunit